jgi:hypothetical protein
VLSAKLVSPKQPVHAIMFFEIFLAAGAVCAFRKLRKHAQAKPTSLLPVLSRAEKTGEIGELRTQAKLRDALQWLWGNDFYLHEGPIILEHAPGTQFPTIEIDHFAVTRFGIFIFESKNWSGNIGASASTDVLLRTTADGKVEKRKSPRAQNRTKVAFLQSTLPSSWPVIAAGVFPSPEAKLSGDLPLDILTLNDIPYWIGHQRELHADANVDINKGVKAICSFQDKSPQAFANHKIRVRRVPLKPD